MFFEGLGKPWWLAFLATFVIAVLLLQMQGLEPIWVGRYAASAAGLVALVVWLLLRKRYAAVPDGGTTPPETAAPPPQPRRRKR